MDKPRVLVAGGAGYIGSHANKALHDRGYDTVVYDNLSTGHREFARWGEFVFADLADLEQLRLVMQRYRPEAVMHFAAFACVGESMLRPERYYYNNVVNTLNLLKVMREYEVKYLIFSSTCATYGLPLQTPITEEHPQQPINPYGRTKLMVENIMADYAAAYGLQYVSLRYFNAAGADPEGDIGEDHDPETHLIPLACHAALGLAPALKIFGVDYDTPDGTCIRDYIHVTDLADAHIRGLEYLMGGGQSDAFNLGNGKGYSVREVIAAAEAASGLPVPVVESERRQGDSPILVSGGQKAEQALQWRPEFPDLESIFRTAWAWHKHRHGKSDQGR